MRKQHTLSRKRATSKRQGGNDPRTKRSEEQVTNTEQQEEIVNEPNIKTDREEENNTASNEPANAIEKNNQQEPNSKEDLKAEV